MVLPQDIFIALALGVAVFGSIIQILPGPAIAVGALLIWAILTGGGTAWLIFGLATAVLASAVFVKFLVAGRHLKRHEVPNLAIIVGLVLGTVLFFVIPVLGLPLGFIGGVYAYQLLALKDQRQAWVTTRVAIVATGLTIMIELSGTLVAIGIWVVGLLVT